MDPYDLQYKLREKLAWMCLPTPCRTIWRTVVMRIGGTRQGMSRDMADMLLGDIANAIARIRKLEYPAGRIALDKNQKVVGKVLPIPTPPPQKPRSGDGRLRTRLSGCQYLIAFHLRIAYLFPLWVKIYPLFEQE